MRLSLKYVSAALAFCLSLTGCEPPNTPVAEGTEAYGALATKKMSEYYYPKTAGWVYVYGQTITEYSSDDNVMSTLTGGYDTLRTLGYQGYSSPTGDSVFAFSVTYRILQERNHKNVFQLYYVRRTGENKSGFLQDNNRTGISNVDSLPAVATAIDTILYAVEGPVRDIIDNPISTDTRVWRTDTIYFTAKGDVVNIWWNYAGTMRRTRVVWEDDLKKNSDWQYAEPIGDPYTFWEVKDERESVTTPDGTFNSVKIRAYTDDLNTSAREVKWWGINKGLVKQLDEWRVTSDGQNFRRKVKIRELISSSKH